MLPKPLQKPAAALGEFDSLDTGSKPIPLSEIFISNSVEWQVMETEARVAAECFRMFVSASWTAKNKW
jgi:hypothetical protein